MAKVICPYCYTTQVLKKMKKICVGEGCEENSKKTEFPINMKTCPKCGIHLRYACSDSKCKKAIENDEISCKNPLPISIYGAKFSGKSNYIASLIWALQANGHDFGLSISANSATAKRYADEYEIPLFKKHMPVETTRAATNAKMRDPLIFMLRTGLNHHKAKRSAFPLSLYDTAGENTEKSDTDTELHVGYVTYAKGIILLVDPWQIPYVKESLGDTIPAHVVGPDPYDTLSRLIRVIRNNSDIQAHEKIKIPIAIAFSKIDSLESGGLLEGGSCLLRESDHIIEQKYSLVEHEDTSSEIESRLECWYGDDVKRFINLATDNFENYAFFGFSSFGCGVKDSKLAGKVKPRRVLDPFLWILSLNKRIETKK